MIFSDNSNLYIKNNSIPKIIKAVGLEEAGIYLIIKSFEFEFPNGVDEIKVLESSPDEIEHTKKLLDNLITKGYVERTKDGIRIINKQI